MKEKIKTFKTAPKLDCQLEDYSYQDLLTPKLDALEGDFDQEIINEIVLWKVNRYAQIKPQILALLNNIKKEDKVFDEKLIFQILRNDHFEQG